MTLYRALLGHVLRHVKLHSLEKVPVTSKIGIMNANTFYKISLDRRPEANRPHDQIWQHIS